MLRIILSVTGKLPVTEIGQRLSLSASEAARGS